MKKTNFKILKAIKAVELIKEDMELNDHFWEWNMEEVKNGEAYDYADTMVEDCLNNPELHLNKILGFMYSNSHNYIWNREKQLWEFKKKKTIKETKIFATTVANEGYKIIIKKCEEGYDNENFTSTTYEIGLGGDEEPIYTTNNLEDVISEFRWFCKLFDKLKDTLNEINQFNMTNITKEKEVNNEKN